MEDPKLLNSSTLLAPENIGDTVIFGSTILLGIGAIVFGGILAVGIITGFLSALGFAFLMLRLRKGNPRIWNSMLDNPGKTDLILSAGFIFLLAPSTATGIIAGASAALFASAMVSIANRSIGKVEGVEPKKFNFDFNKIKIGQYSPIK